MMKKAEKYIEDANLHDTFLPYGENREIHDPDCGFCYYEKKVEEIIEQAQIAAIDAAVKMCAEEAEIEFVGDNWAEIERQSILQVADKLKKELG